MAWNEMLIDPISEVVNKREAVVKEAQEFFDNKEYAKTRDKLKVAMDLSVQIKDKESQKRIKEMLENVEEQIRIESINKLMDNFKKEANKSQSISTVLDVMSNFVEIFMKAFIVLEDKINERIGQMEERIRAGDADRDVLAEGMKTITELLKTIQENQQDMKNQVASAGTTAPAAETKAPAKGSKAKAKAASSPTEEEAPPLPPVARAPKPDRPKPEVPMSTMSLKGSLMSELEGVLSKRRKAVDESEKEC
jgi:hypothetical protein